LKGKKYIKKSEEEIEKAVKAALLKNPRVSLFEITPEVEGRIVILRGTVDNIRAKRAAGSDAANTVGVRRVDNRIKVRPEKRLSDEKIENSVKNALARDAHVERYDITVDVKNGVLNLYGAVNDYFEKARADYVTSGINGVVAINNHLVVRNRYKPYIYDPYVDEGKAHHYDWYTYGTGIPEKSDKEIKASIEKEIDRSPFVNIEDVKIEVDEGKATLTGKVSSRMEFNAATKNAYQGGAVYVDNEMTVISE
jgi:osmotically-inducible protein OsmY